MKSSYTNVGTNIKILAKSQGIPIGELERELGIARGYFSTVARKNITISLDLAIRVANKLGVRVERLVDPREVYIREYEALIRDKEEELVTLREELAQLKGEKV